jgi:hypothetical protein
MSIVDEGERYLTIELMFYIMILKMMFRILSLINNAYWFAVFERYP